MLIDQNQCDRQSNCYVRSHSHSCIAVKPSAHALDDAARTELPTLPPLYASMVHTYSSAPHTLQLPSNIRVPPHYIQTRTVTNCHAQAIQQSLETEGDLQTCHVCCVLISTDAYTNDYSSTFSSMPNTNLPQDNRGAQHSTQGNVHKTRCLKQPSQSKYGAKLNCDFPRMHGQEAQRIPHPLC